MEAPEYLDLDEIDFSDDISVSISLILSVSRATIVRCLSHAVLVVVAKPCFALMRGDTLLYLLSIICYIVAGHLN